MTPGWGFDIISGFICEVATTRVFTEYIPKHKTTEADLAACHGRPEDGVLISPARRELGPSPLGYASRYDVEVVYSKSNAQVECAVESRFGRAPP